jgi:hypothetical protein
VISSPLLLGDEGGYQISRSVRLRSSASAYLNRTPATAGNQQKWTLSLWIKRGALGNPLQKIFEAGSSSANYLNITWNGSGGGAGSDQLDMYANVGSAQALYFDTASLYRDPAAWYHIVIAVDTTQATSTNRVKFYVNGSQLTAFTTANYPAQNTSLAVNGNVPHAIGNGAFTNSNYFDGYLAETQLIDGQQLTPSSFGETNAVTGVWQPKAYSGTYGTNGFYLNFSDNSGATATTIGKDYSGNGNNWTPNNISVTAGVTYDSMIDVPTLYADGGNGRGNYAVLNPVDLGYSASTSEANLKVSTASSGNAAASSTIAMSFNTYWEVTIGSNSQVGLLWGRASDAYGASSISMFASGATGSLNNATRTLSATPSWSNGDTLGLAWNSSTRVLTLYQAGSATAVMTITSPTTGDPQAVITNYTSGSAMSSQVNFGQRPFTYTPPSGFVALNTQNLPTPTISNGASYMAATTYTGTGSALTIANTVGSASFQPDFVWLKNRASAYSHLLYDSIRGTSLYLSSNTTGAEVSYALALTAFNSNGFSVGTDPAANESTKGIVGWQWNAGGSTVTNTSGTISAQVRANPTAGFSVVTYTGTGANATVGHGLGVAPSWVICKRRNSTGGWPIFVKALNNNAKYMTLNNTDAANTDSTVFNNTAPTSTVFSLGTDTFANANTGTYVAYCFAEVAGYSAFGSYTGNGSADGPFVYTGFRPRWIMIKASSAARGWIIFDTARDPYNVSQYRLFANTADAESSGTTANNIDILSNGFKPRLGANSEPSNESGTTYIYMAFAENSFKNALAR